MMRWLGRLAVSLLMLTATMPGSASAQDSLRAAAVVNDEVISQLDLNMRLRLVMVSSGMQGGSQQMRRLAPQVLQNLINERLQLQEARRLDLEVTDSEIRSGVDQIASRNNMPGDSFLAALEQRGIMRETFTNRIKANIAWQKVLGREVRPQVSVSNADVEDVIERRKARAGQRLLRLREIFLPAEDGEIQQARQTAQRLISELRNGAEFAALARQFSQSATAAVGGDLGWITPQSLPENVANAARNISKGQLAGPIQDFGGIYIIALQDVRTQAGSDTTLTLKQLLIPNSAAEDGNTEALREQVTNLGDSIEACSDVESVAEASDVANAINLGELKLNDMPETIRQTVADLETGDVSEPIAAGGGVGVLVVCDKTTPGLDRAAIERNLVRQRMDMLARRYMRDLRRQAYIDIRLEGL